jgi:hypothetical protein
MTMKKLVLVALGVVCASVVVAQIVASNTSSANSLRNAVFAWSETVYDFGKIELNVPVTHEFTFSNTGDVPLVITGAKASCGCTVTEYSKNPIEPGARGFVKATYNAAKVGVFSKTVTLNANTDEGTVVLSIKGEVEEKNNVQ